MEMTLCTGGRKSEYNEAGTQSNQRQDVMYGGTFSTLISQLSTTFLPWNISLLDTEL
ncbi:MAG: hypothetical protein MJB12_19945 [Firmicutes bacterium]|nr:hypothetical protein [Bacillota bacterium]